MQGIDEPVNMQGYDPNAANELFKSPEAGAQQPENAQPSTETKLNDMADKNTQVLADDPPKTEEKPKAKSPLEKVGKLKKPEEPTKEEPKADGQKPAEQKPKSNEDNIRLLRQAKEEWDKVKPEYEKTKTEYEQTKSELAATKEELTKLKALGLNEAERNEYQKYKDLHAVEAVKNSEEYQKNVLQPIQSRVNKIIDVGKKAGLDQNAVNALLDAVDIPDEWDRSKAIRGILQNADLEVEDYQLASSLVIEAAKDLTENLYPKEDSILQKARDIEIASREREKNAAQEMSKKEQEEFAKEHQGLVEQLASDHLKLLLDDTDLSIEGTTMSEAMKTATPADNPQEKAYQAIAGASLPFVMQWAQKILNENNQLKAANNVRNKTTPGRGDGLPKTQAPGEQKLTIEEVFGKR